MDESTNPFFHWYLLRQRLRIVGVILMRDAVAPWAVPTCNWIERRLSK